MNSRSLLLVHFEIKEHFLGYYYGYLDHRRLMLGVSMDGNILLSALGRILFTASVSKQQLFEMFP